MLITALTIPRSAGKAYFLAQDVLNHADAVASAILSDVLTDEGSFPMLNSVQVGKRYLFKTYGLFYDGTVEMNDGQTIVLASGSIQLVVDVGSTDNTYQNDSYSYSERFPSGKKVHLNSLHIHAVEER